MTGAATISTRRPNPLRAFGDMEQDLHEAVCFVRALDTMVLFTEHNPPDERDFTAAAMLLEMLAPRLDRIKGDVFALMDAAKPIPMTGGAA